MEANKDVNVKGGGSNDDFTIVRQEGKRSIDIMTFAFIASLIPIAFAVLEFLVVFPKLTDNPKNLILTALISLSTVAMLIYFGIIIIIVRRNNILCPSNHGSAATRTTRPTLAQVFFCFTVFTSAIDLGITGHMLGFWEMGSFYIHHGERYFNTTYGIAALGWDGIFHLPLQFILAYRSLQGWNLKPVGLVWAGSVINSLTPLLLGGAATGKYSSDVEMATAMNIPFIIIPISFAVGMFQEETTTHTKTTTGTTKQQNDEEDEISSGIPIKSTGGKCSSSFFLAVIIAGTHLMLLSLHILRAMAALKSEAPVAIVYLIDYEPALAEQPGGTNVILVQCLQNLFFFGVYHSFSIWDILVLLEGSQELVTENAFCFMRTIDQAADWSILVLGGYLQGFFVTALMATVTYDGPGMVSVIGFGDNSTTTYPMFGYKTTLRTWYIAILVSCIAGIQALYFAFLRREQQHCRSHDPAKVKCN